MSTTPIATALVCAGCGFRVPAGGAAVLRCPVAVPGDDVDHVMTRIFDAAAVGPFPVEGPGNPFVRYRRLFHAWHVARSLGWGDEAYTGLVEQLDDEVARVDGRGFRTTPFARSAGLSERLGFSARGGVWVKDETGNVSGSHKARHLFGTLLELEVESARVALGTLPGQAGERPPLAIASCGNAALAAAVVARAAGRPLDVFVPPDADEAVLARLRALGARIETCERQPGVAGDPTYHRLLAALHAGAVPFTCQGNLNGFAIEGGETLGWEIAATIGRPGGPAQLDRIVVQVGGGALASATSQGLAEARALGVPFELPRLHAVQTRGAFPLARAFERVSARIAGGETVDEAIGHAARLRSAFMWPWEEAPRSIAHGILDDETYDWLAVVRAMLETGGGPVVVDEATLVVANELAVATTGSDVDETGSSGLAGLVHLVRQGEIGPDEFVAVLFTGVRRRIDHGASQPAAEPASRSTSSRAMHGGDR